MSQPSNQRKERPNTYFVQDRSSNDERDRVYVQDIMVTKGMGGPLPEQPQPHLFRRVLDVGCGTGGWLIETAKAYPEIKLLIGIDVSKHMIEYAREQANAEKVADRVEFHVMDSLRMIEFPQYYFDLVNQRFGWSYLRTWDWPDLLAKYLHVTRRGGVIRVTEGRSFDTSTSPALTLISDLAFDAFYQAGHLFTREIDGMVTHLPELFDDYGIVNVQMRPIVLEYRVGSEMMENFFEDARLALRTVVPFLRKWSHVPDNYEEIYQQALKEIQQPDCVTQGHITTVWGTRK